MDRKVAVDELVPPELPGVPVQLSVEVDSMVTGEENVSPDPSIKGDFLTVAEKENVLGMVDCLQDLMSQFHAQSTKMMGVMKGINDRPGVGDIDADYLFRPILGNMKNVHVWMSNFVRDGKLCKRSTFDAML